VRACRVLAAACLLAGAVAGAAEAQDPGSEEPAWGVEPAPAAAQERESQRTVSLRGGIGFTADPETFLMSLEVPFTITELFSAGPQLRLGVSDEELYFAPTVQGYFTPRLGGDYDVIRPYGSLGLGIAFLENDDRASGRDDEDVDFLLTPGFGVEYAISDQLFAGTAMQLDVIPAGATGERFVFSWQVLTFRAAW
jgi:hypothetical protein